MPENPGGQTALTAAAYTSLSPRAKGYAAYMQGAWNPNVPDKCPFRKGTSEASDWHDGNNSAMVAVLDMEE